MKRCHRCDHPWSDRTAPGFNNTCAQCGMPLHACSNCAKFVPRGAIRCLLPNPPRVLNPKDANQCAHFEFLDTGSASRTAGGDPGGRDDDDPRKAWERLFEQG